MAIPLLLKTYHQDEAASAALYHALYHSPLAHRLNIPIKQLHARRSFPAFYYYTGEIAQIFSSLMAEMRHLTAVTATLPGAAIHAFHRSCLIEEIQSSNAIEGVRSTRKEIKTAIDEQAALHSPNRVRLWSTVHQYLKLQQREEIPFRDSHDLRAFYDEFLSPEIIRDDPQNLPDGKIFRQGPVDVWSKTKIMHHGVVPEETIIQYMDRALRVLQDEKIPGLVRVSLFHYLFGYIHPFYDGNGRTARFITSYYLAKFLHPLVAIRLSLTIKRSLRVYYKLFADTNHQGNYGDLTPFVTGFLWLVQKSTSRVNEILQERRAKLDVLSQRLKTVIVKKTDWNIYFILLQGHLFSDDGATVEEIARTTGQSIRTVHAHLKQYPPAHITVNKSHRAHRFKLSSAFVTALGASAPAAGEEKSTR